MDTKSLAKSKRAHSQHHSKKHHPKQTSKAPASGSVGPTSSQKPSLNQIREKSHHNRGSKALPSNWDRYEDEYDSDSEIPSQGRTSQLTDDIVPKSKGADYAHLISEAKSQAQTSYLVESFPSFDDVFTDFNQDVVSLLSVRGQSILSWIEDDNFLVEDKATGGQVASFLSLDLNAVAEQLSKVDISQRLFVEADILPELYNEELQASFHEGSSSKDKRTFPREAYKGGSELCDETKQTDPLKNEDKVLHDLVITGTNAIRDSDKDEQSKSKRTDESFIPLMPESRTQFSVSSSAVQNKFEAAVAEAELDMLLDSFSEPTILKSAVSEEEPSCRSNMLQPVASTSASVESSSDRLVSSHMKTSSELSNFVLTADLDDTLDKLLEETSNQISPNISSLPPEVKAVSHNVLSSPSPGPASKSNVLDDFDSWLDTI